MRIAVLAAVGVLGSLCSVIAPAPAMAGEMKYSDYMALDASKQNDYAKNKAKRSGGYYVCKLGRYTINAEGGPAEAIRWALLLDAYTDEVLDEGIVPKKKLIPSAPQVYILNNKESYAKALNTFAQEPIDPGWSVGMFYHKGFKAALFGYDYSSELKSEESVEGSSKKEDTLTSTLLHECTHQMVFYHLGTGAPLWFNEGIATNMEMYNCDMDMKANLYNAMYLNNRADGAAIMNEKGLLRSFPSLFRITSSEWRNASDDQAQINYCSAWAACNFFFTCKKGRKFVGKLMDEVKKNNWKPDGKENVAKMLSDEDLAEIDGLIKEHCTKVLLPACKYGRVLRKLLNDGDKDKAALGVEAMKKEFPDSNEMKFYQAWLDILNNKEPAVAAKTVADLRKTSDFNHPEANYVMALGYFKGGNKSAASSALADALKSNAKHKGTLELKKEMGR